MSVALNVSAVGGEGHSGLIDGNAHQVVIQLYGVACTIVYDAVVSLILLKVIDLVIGLRVDADTEREGLDLAACSAYSDSYNDLTMLSMVGDPCADIGFWAATTALRARGVKRSKPPFGSSVVVSARNTKRFWAACLVTPMLLPISVQEAPDRRA